MGTQFQDSRHNNSSQNKPDAINNKAAIKWINIQMLNTRPVSHDPPCFLCAKKMYSEIFFYPPLNRAKRGKP